MREPTPGLLEGRWAGQGWRAEEGRGLPRAGKFGHPPPQRGQHGWRLPAPAAASHPPQIVPRGQQEVDIQCSSQAQVAQGGRRRRQRHRQALIRLHKLRHVQGVQPPALVGHRAGSGRDGVGGPVGRTSASVCKCCAALAGRMQRKAARRYLRRLAGCADVVCWLQHACPGQTVQVAAVARLRLERMASHTSGATS